MEVVDREGEEEELRAALDAELAIGEDPIGSYRYQIPFKLNNIAYER